MRRDEQKQYRRELILRTAEEIFINRGLAATNMSDIAGRVSLSVRTLYRYYKTKEELAFEIEIRIFETMNEKIAAAAEQIQGKSGFDRVKEFLALIQKYYLFSENEIRFMGEFDHYFRNTYPYNELSNRFVKMMQTMDNPLCAMIKDGITDGSIRSDVDIPLAAGTIGNAMLALAQRVVIRAEHLEDEQGIIPSLMPPYLTELIVEGLRPRPGLTI